MTERVTVNLPDELYIWVNNQSIINRRSISNQIVWFLEQERSKENS